MKLRFPALFTLLLAGCGSRSSLDLPLTPDPLPNPTCMVTSDRPIVMTTKDVAIAHPESFRTMSGGATVLRDDGVLWGFSEVVLQDLSTRPSTTARANPMSPLSMEFSIDGAGAPRELVPLTPSERTYNEVHSPDEKLVVWPGAMAKLDSGETLVFWEKILVKPGFLNMTPVHAGVARLAPLEVVARRLEEPLFAYPETHFGIASFVRDGYIHLYGCSGGFLPNEGCRVARAPVDRAMDRGAYRAWDGSSWSSDLRGKPLFDQVPGALSVAWHPHLGKLVAFHTEAFTNKIVMRTADRPEGPWSAPTLAFQTASDQDYAGVEQWPLQTDCGRKTLVTYYHPTGPASGELHAILLTMK